MLKTLSCIGCEYQVIITLAVITHALDKLHEVEPRVERLPFLLILVLRNQCDIYHVDEDKIPING